jgi:hypothetical protein
MTLLDMSYINESAAQELERRKDQNRRSQHRHRERKRLERENQLFNSDPPRKRETHRVAALPRDISKCQDCERTDVNATKRQALSLSIMTQTNLSSGLILYDDVACGPISFKAINFYEVAIKACQVFEISMEVIMDASTIFDISLTWQEQEETRDSSPASSNSNEMWINWKGKPENMNPTALQLSVPHHPGIDTCFPWPCVRDKLVFLLGTLIDTSEFCHDLVIGLSDGNGIAEESFHVWGDDTFDTQAWEVGQRFASKYNMLLTSQMIKTSNWWRKQRNLPALNLG